jgi:hypothetical protein
MSQIACKTQHVDVWWSYSILLCQSIKLSTEKYLSELMVLPWHISNTFFQRVRYLLCFSTSNLEQCIIKGRKSITNGAITPTWEKHTWPRRQSYSSFPVSTLFIYCAWAPKPLSSMPLCGTPLPVDVPLKLCSRWCLEERRKNKWPPSFLDYTAWHQHGTFIPIPSYFQNKPRGMH